MRKTPFDMVAAAFVPNDSNSLNIEVLCEDLERDNNFIFNKAWRAIYDSFSVADLFLMENDQQ